MGMRLLYLGARLKNKITLRTMAWPFMQELAEETHKTIELLTLDRDQFILIEQIEGTEGVRLYSRVGGAYPYFHALAAGKVYLAHMALEKRRNVLDKIGLPAVTEHTITNVDKLDGYHELVPQVQYWSDCYDKYILVRLKRISQEQLAVFEGKIE